MTTHERVQAVIDYGFTDREARFLARFKRAAKSYCSYERTRSVPWSRWLA
jgi:hypothetical protein